MHIDVIQASGASPIQQGKQGLKNGDVIHGKVAQGSDGKATVSLQDGSSFTATLAEGVELAEGQQVKLMVTGQQDGKMVMQLVPESEGQAKQMVENTLTAMNVGTGGRNTDVAAAFLRQGMSLSPELVQKAADIMAKNPGLDPDTAAFMAANDIPSDLAAAVKDLASRQNNLGVQLATLEQILIESGGQKAEAAQPETGQGNAPQLEGVDGQTTQTGSVHVATDGQPTAQPDQLAGAGQKSASQTGQTNQPDRAVQPAQAQQTEQAGQPTQAAQTGHADQTNQHMQPDRPVQLNQPTQTAHPNQPETAAGMTKAQPEATQPAQTDTNGQTTQGHTAQAQQPVAEAITNNTTTSVTQAEQQPQPASANVSTAQAETLPSAAASARQAQATPVSTAVLPQETADMQQSAPQAIFQPGSETVKALTLYIGRDNPGAVAALQADGVAAAAQAMAEAASIPEAQGEALLEAFVSGRDINPADGEKLLAQLKNASNALRDGAVDAPQSGAGKLLEKLEGMFTKLEQNAAKGIDIKQAANRLPEKLEDMHQAITKAAVGNKEAMAATVQRAIGQSKAMEQINQFVYTQIPVDINGRKDMAELYVFKRPGKQKRIDPEQVTMVVALDTQNMGHVESIIKVEGKSVFLRFRVDSDGVADALKGSAPEMGQALNDVGYKLLELRCELYEEDISILNAATTTQAEFLDLRNLDIQI